MGRAAKLPNEESGSGVAGREAILTIQRLSAADFTTLHNCGIRSVQIVWPKNAPEAWATISRVTMEPGATSARHVHPESEQIWLIEKGNALLLTSDGQTEGLQAGDVVRTPPGTIHGVTNTGTEPFIYLAVTTPPQDFAPAYEGRQDVKPTDDAGLSFL